MGFFSFLSSVAHSVGNFFRGAASTVSSDVHAAGTTIANATSTVYKDAKVLHLMFITQLLILQQLY